jgi:hypothetical protein
MASFPSSQGDDMATRTITLNGGLEKVAYSDYYQQSPIGLTSNNMDLKIVDAALH